MKEHKRCLLRNRSDFTHKEDLARKTTAQSSTRSIVSLQRRAPRTRAESNIAECIDPSLPPPFFYSTSPLYDQRSSMLALYGTLPSQPSKPCAWNAFRPVWRDDYCKLTGWSERTSCYNNSDGQHFVGEERFPALRCFIR